MKAVKISSVLCLIILVNGFFNLNAYGQTTENPAPVDKKTSAAQQTNKPITVDDSLIPNSSNYRIPNSDDRQSNDRYRIGFQDTLKIDVFRHEDLSQVVNVSPDGTIRMPRIEKPIVAVCKTEGELKTTIETHLKSYLKNPFVNVKVVSQLSQPIAVIGAVEKPGNFYLNRPTRLLELLAYAGGPKVDRAGAKIQVARVGNVTGCTEAVEVSENTDKEVAFLGFNTNEVMAGKENPWMQPGDIVSVLDAEEAYIVGNVLKPTKISLKETVTLTRAIAIAEGLNDTARTSRVVIQRQGTGNQAKTELAYNLKDIYDKKIPDPILQANDIVEIANDKGKSVRKGLFDVLKSGVPSILYRFP
jgi:polysaccharide export outer membrane protein